MFNTKLFLFIYLLDLCIFIGKAHLQREETESLPPQMTAVVGAELISAQDQGVSNGSAVWVQGPKVLSQPHYFPRPQQGAEGSSAAGFKPLLLWHFGSRMWRISQLSLCTGHGQDIFLKFLLSVAHPYLIKVGMTEGQGKMGVIVVSTFPFLSLYLGGGERQGEKPRLLPNHWARILLCRY